MQPQVIISFRPPLLQMLKSPMLTLIASICFLQLICIESFAPCSSLNDPKCNTSSPSIQKLGQFHSNTEKLQHAITTKARVSTSTSLQTAFLDTLAVSGVLTGLNQAFMKAPLASAFVTCGLKASVADVIAQRREYNADLGEQSNSNDPKGRTLGSLSLPRNLAFLLYGGLYLGIGQHYLYNHLYPIWFGPSRSFKVLTTKVFFDLCCVSTALTLPLPYLTKAIVSRKCPTQGLKDYVHDCIHKGLWAKNFVIWTPIQFLAFGVVPEHLRVMFIAAFSFFWLIIFSSISARR